MKIINNINQEERNNLIRLLQSKGLMPSDVSAFDEFLNQSELLELKKGEFLFRTGETVSSFYVTIEGIMKLWHRLVDREEILFFSLPPTFFFNFHSNLLMKESLCNCEACDTVRVLRLKKHNFDAMLKRSHSFCQWTIEWMRNQLYYFEKKMILRGGTAKDQYESICKNYPDLIKSVSLQDIASYLKITPQYLSKLRKF